MLVVTSSSICLSLNTVDDHSRVILKPENNQSRSDYINASPIVSSHADYLHILCIMPNNGSENTSYRFVHVKETLTLFETQYLCPFLPIAWTLPGLF